MPRGDRGAPTRVLLFDSWFDPCDGAVILVRVFDGTLRRGDRIRLRAAGLEREVQSLQVVAPHPREVGGSQPGRSGC